MRRQRIDLYDGPTTLGVDVSAYNREVDFDELVRLQPTLRSTPQGPVEYVIVRSSDGIQTRRNSAPDPFAHRNLTEAARVHLRRAVYHYVRAHHGAEAQVELILEVLRKAGVNIGFVVLDCEGRPDDPTTVDTDESHGAWWHPKGTPEVDTLEVLDDLATMTRLLQRAGHRVLFYTGVAWHFYVAQRGLLPDWHHLYSDSTPELWTANYTRQPYPLMPVDPHGDPAPWEQWRIWQYSSKGVATGINGGVDLNRFRGDSQALARWWDGYTVKPDSHTSKNAPLDRALEQILSTATELKKTHPDRAARLVREAEQILDPNR